jgi:branched-chain amino acid aminotransferase
MVEKLDKIWMDGKLVDWDAATVHVMTHSLHYGVAAFEGIRAYQREGGPGGLGAGTFIFRLKEHIDRLFDSCKMALIPPKFTRGEVMQACIDLLRHNKMQDGYLRPIVYVGEGAMGVYAPDNPVRTAVMAWKWGVYLGEEGLTKGIRCKISSFARHHVNVSLAKGKISGQYTNSVLAKREAKLGGYDEAVMLDPNGYVSEGSGENIFLVKHGAILTPDLSSSILEGITRDAILSLAREEGIPVVEGRVTRDQLWLADEAFLTGTAAEVTPIREIDDRPIGAGSVGPVTKRLQTRFFEIVRGKDSSHSEWLTKV